ncbi:hypothetical protein D9M72_459370 [compost metagenome]
MSFTRGTSATVGASIRPPTMIIRIGLLKGMLIRVSPKAAQALSSVVDTTLTAVTRTLLNR